MLFCSYDYALFFILIFCLYWAMPWHRARVWLLLGASVYFYACWNKWLALLIVATSTADYAIGQALERLKDERRRKLLLGFSLVANLGMLAAFKYANFFLESFETVLRGCGAGVSIPLFKLILPVGISFYTFEAVNYTVDVYRRRVQAERSLPHFLLFITFFPHLVAGPIVRARDFLPQIKRPKRWDWSRAELGVSLFVMGLFKKMAIADRMATYADPVFANPEAYGSHAVWIATIAYAIQIYCDFSGYTDMALGSAHLFGYKLSPNFRMPYLSTNIAEFWRRWHISLSSWLRDYLFIPLGGSRGGGWQTARNLIITMTLGGLWHGASWTFVVWGLLHGVLLVMHRVWRSMALRLPVLDRSLKTSGGTVLRIGMTFLTVSIGWIVFRSTTFASALTMIERLAFRRDGLPPPLPTDLFWVLIAIVMLAHAVGSFRPRRGFSRKLPAELVGFGYAAVVTLGLLLAPDNNNQFIYFQF